MLSCKEFDQFMIDYLEGELPMWRRYACWLHIKMCRECSHFVRQYQRTVELGQHAFDNPEDQLPDSVPEALVKAALSHRRKE